MWDEAGGRLVLHMARANPHWKAIEPGTAALAVVSGPEAYVSPAWYATKAEHGKVVPTWNYSAVHFTGRVTARHDPAWLREAVTLLTGVHEGRRAAAGHEAVVGRRRARDVRRGSAPRHRRPRAAWWSGSRPRPSSARTGRNADRAGVVAGLRAEDATGLRGEAQVADRMDHDLA